MNQDVNGNRKFWKEVSKENGGMVDLYQNNGWKWEVEA